MRRFLILALAVGLLISCKNKSTSSTSDSKSDAVTTTDSIRPDLPKNLAQQFHLVWQDEFSGTVLDTTKWNYRAEGTKRHYATVNRQTISLDGQGHLAISVLKNEDGSYSVGQTGTEGIFETTYGYFECRAKMNQSIGPHVAFWLQSPDIHKTGDNPALNGSEVDVFEYHRVTPDTVHHNIHWNGYGPEHHRIGKMINYPDIDNGFHTFGMLWTKEKYVFFVDGQKTWETTHALSHRPEYLILSTELTGFGGNPENGHYPDRVVFDYVRVFKPES